MLTWQARATPIVNNWSCIIWANELSLFIVVANAGGANDTKQVMTSPDGITWTARTAPTGNWLSVAWSPSLRRLVAVGTGVDVNHLVMTSPDGINWTLRAVNTVNQWLSVAWSPTLALFVAVADTFGGFVPQVMTSPDGITWTDRLTPLSATQGNNWRQIVWSPERGLFVVVASHFGADDTKQVMTSPDGINWSLQSTPVIGVWNSVTWNATVGLFVSPDQSSTQTMTSPDGIVWTLRIGTPSSNGMVGITSSPAPRFVIVTAYGGGVDDTHQAIESPDGLTWTLDATPSHNNWFSVAWSPPYTLFAAVSKLVGDDNTHQIMTSFVSSTVTPGPAGRKIQVLIPNKFDACLHREYRLHCNIDYDAKGCARLPKCFTVDEREWGDPV